MEGKVSLSVDHMTGLGVDIQMVLKGLRAMKEELQQLGCQVNITICGQELKLEEGRKAGNETRTRDILLGKNSVTPTRESAAAADPAQWEQCGNCGEFRIKFHGRAWEIDPNTGNSKPMNVFECRDCGYLWNEVAE